MNNEQDLNFENEFLKLKLMAENGAIISESKLNPMVENSWLKYIVEFEEAASEKRMIKVFDKVQRPSFSLDIDDQFLVIELERLLNHLNKFNIEICTLCEVSDRELYRFIIADLFEKEMIDIRNDVAISTFTYEDFYPNNRYDILNIIDDFKRSLIKKDIGLYSWIFADNFTSVTGEVIGEQEVMKHLNYFLQHNTVIDLMVSNSSEFAIEGDIAILQVEIKLENVQSDCLPPSLTGTGTIVLKDISGWWNITAIDITGLRI